MILEKHIRLKDIVDQIEIEFDKVTPYDLVLASSIGTPGENYYLFSEKVVPKNKTTFVRFFGMSMELRHANIIYPSEFYRVGMHFDLNGKSLMRNSFGKKLIVLRLKEKERHNWFPEVLQDFMNVIYDKHFKNNKSFDLNKILHFEFLTRKPSLIEQLKFHINQQEIDSINKESTYFKNNENKIYKNLIDLRIKLNDTLFNCINNTNPWRERECSELLNCLETISKLFYAFNNFRNSVDFKKRNEFDKLPDKKQELVIGFLLAAKPGKHKRDIFKLFNSLPVNFILNLKIALQKLDHARELKEKSFLDSKDMYDKAWDVLQARDLICEYEHPEPLIESESLIPYGVFAIINTFKNCVDKEIKNLYEEELKKEIKLKDSAIESQKISEKHNQKVQKIIRGFTHGLGHDLVPQNILDVIKKLKNTPGNEDIIWKLTGTYYSEINTSNMAKLMKICASDDKNLFGQIIRNGIITNGTGHKSIKDIIEFSINNVLRRRILEKGYKKSSLHNIRDNLSNLHKIDFSQIVQSYKNNFSSPQSQNIIDWCNNNFGSIEINIKDIWNKVLIKHDSLTETFFINQFSELIFNSMKYRDYTKNKWIIIDLDNALIENNMYLRVTFKNPYKNNISIGNKEGINDLRESLTQLNNQIPNFKTCEINDQNGVFIITLYYAKDLFIKKTYAELKKERKI